MAGDINVVIQHTQAALDEAHLIAGTTNPQDQIVQLTAALAAMTTERDNAVTAKLASDVKVAEAIVLVDELTIVDATEDTKRAELRTKLTT
jgi:hypothetical protein